MSQSARSVSNAESVTRAVVRAVARDKDVAVTDLSPLYDAVDPDALCSLFDGTATGEVVFAYEGREVVVTSADEVRVR